MLAHWTPKSPFRNWKSCSPSATCRAWIRVPANFGRCCWKSLKCDSLATLNSMRQSAYLKIFNLRAADLHQQTAINLVGFYHLFVAVIKLTVSSTSLTAAHILWKAFCKFANKRELLTCTACCRAPYQKAFPPKFKSCYGTDCTVTISCQCTQCASLRMHTDQINQ